MHRIPRTLSLLGIAAALSLTAGPAALASGSGGTSSGGGGIVGGTKPACQTTLSVAASATESLAGNSFSATYALGSCQSRTKVSLTATDLSSGATVWSAPDLIGTTAVWSLPYTLTTYRIDARAYSGQTGATLVTAWTTVGTLDALPCDRFLAESATVGYFGIYPAIWAATNAQSCGLAGTRVRLRITNLRSGQVQVDTSNLALSSMYDFEGPIVSYDTPYEIDADLLSATSEVLATTTTSVTSTPLR